MAEKECVGLVLEGGAMRGMFTAGVLDVLLDRQITFDRIAGVSAGAVFGVNFLSRQRGRVIRYNKRFNGDKNYMGLRPYFREGNFVSTKYAYEVVPRDLDPFDDETYQSAGVPFHAVVTNVETGRPEYMPIRSVFGQMDVLRASGSMPFLSRPVTIGGKRYLDGGISDSIPYHWLWEQGCRRLVVVLTQDMAYRKKPMSPALIRLWYGKDSPLSRQLLQRHTAYNRLVEELKQWEQDGRAFAIRPSLPIKIGRMERDPEKLEAVYRLGLADAQCSLEKLLEFLA